jgi:hypothetical protein
MADLSQGLREAVGLEISSLEKHDQVLKEHKLFRDSNGQRVQTRYRSREINWTKPAMVKADRRHVQYTRLAGLHKLARA